MCLYLPSVMYVYCSFVITCWERNDLLALSCVMVSCAFVTFQYGVLGQMWYLIGFIPDLCLLSYFYILFPLLSQKLLILQEFLPLLKCASSKDSPKTAPWERAAILNISSLIGSVTENKYKQFYHYSTTKVSLRHRSK